MAHRKLPVHPGDDRTVNSNIGGKQARPGSGYSVSGVRKKKRIVGRGAAGKSQRHRNAVEAARKADGWGKTTAHNRAQVLFYMRKIFRNAQKRFRSDWRGGGKKTKPRGEVQLSMDVIFLCGLADKLMEGAHPALRNISIAMNEPFGHVGAVCPGDAPLLGFFPWCSVDFGRQHGSTVPSENIR